MVDEYLVVLLYSKYSKMTTVKERTLKPITRHAKAKKNLTPTPTPTLKPKVLSSTSSKNVKIKKPVTLKKKDDNGGLDEKGNPYPIENPEGGDPICPSGYKIDYDFDVFDPINPPFRCISYLKDLTDTNKINKIMNKLNNPSNNITRVARNIIMPPVRGGARRRTRTRARIQHNHRHNSRTHRGDANTRRGRHSII